MSRGREVLVGFVILAAVVGGVLGTLWLQGTNWGRPAAPVEVLLDNAAQLTEGSAVKLRGVQIGRVGSVAVEPDGQAVRLVLELQREANLPRDAVVLLSPESFFGEWQAEVVTRHEYPTFPFFDVTGVEPRLEGAPLLGGYALPEFSRLTASADQISANLAELSERLEIAFNDETASQLSQAITDIAAISQQLREFVNTQSNVATSLSVSADSALGEIERASRSAAESFERVAGLLGDSQMDSIVTNVRLASASIQELTADLSASSGGMSATMERADSVFARIDRLTERVESGQGALGRLMSDSTLAIRTEEVLRQLDLLLQDLRENPRRYVRLSIF